ncbi:MAG: ParA family protein [Candidatus Paracaedibacteraceae bacterium]|nr:ParA family protein [Candidatus Paracaedibacteraceae bacterium]
MNSFSSIGITQKMISILAGVNLSTVNRWITKNNVQALPKAHENSRNVRYPIGEIRKFFQEYVVLKELKNNDLVLSFYNFKGGTGKTSICYQVSTHLALMGYNVLVIDADPQGHLSTSLGFDNNHNFPTLFDVVQSKITIDEAIVNIFPGLNCIPSNLSLTRLEVVLSNSTKREEILLRQLENLRGKYDFIIFDSNPTISLLNRNILVCSDLISIICETQPYSLNGLKMLMEDMTVFFSVMRMELPEILIVPNKYEDRSTNSAEAMTVLRQFYSQFMMTDFAFRKSEDIPTSAKQSLPLAFFARANSLALEDTKDLIPAILNRLQLSLNIDEKIA